MKRKKRKIIIKKVKKVIEQDKRKRQIKKDKQMNMNNSCDFGSHLPLVLRPIMA